MMKKTNGLALLPKKRDAFTAIRRFMMDGDVQLKVEEEEILKRWIQCDALLKAKILDEQGIIDRLVKQFKVSSFTARNDIYYTQRMFADARKVIKKYLIHHHLERIDRDIQSIRKKLFANKKIPDAKQMAALAKMHETYTYTLNSIPEDVQHDKQPPPIFQFILAPGQVIERPMQLEDAMKKADEFIDLKETNGVYAQEE